AEVLDNGEQVIQETRRWDEVQGKTISMRSKEEAHDYRYFPDPDLVTMHISDEWMNEIKATIPELPDARKGRYTSEYGLSSYDAEVITASLQLAELFEDSLKYTNDAKAVANWMMGEMLGYLNANNLEPADAKVNGQDLGELVGLIENGTISNKIAKTVFRTMMESGKAPKV